MSDTGTGRPAVLELRRVSKVYGQAAAGVHALRDATLSVEAGSVVAVVYPVFAVYGRGVPGVLGLGDERWWGLSGLGGPGPLAGGPPPLPARRPGRPGWPAPPRPRPPG